ncbi:signal peptidase I [Marinoscillum furvescens]|uniref:Signal peptidase I n=1 Tax=Marinoscillum furvescens DSM 4134 TaxID=1122208 RepID=A0A3D9L113_MARFU|nr:signal peptidase I [Marinoscillum furvescens]RED94938.1 signal peptidase I [Marinoscillum furvescens DSM 4134]
MGILELVKSQKKASQRLSSYLWLLMLIGVSIAVIRGLVWIGVLFGAVLLSVYLWKKTKRKEHTALVGRLFSAIRYFYAIVTVFMVGICMRLFFFEVYAIPSSSMEATLVPGDKIVVNKLAYGPVLPRSPLEVPWVNLFFYLTMDSITESDRNWWGYRRLAGFTDISEGDVLVFTKGAMNETPFIKRCVAGPGRELVVINAIPDHFTGDEIHGTLVPMDIWTHDVSATMHRLDSIGINSRRSAFLGARKSNAALQARLPTNAIERVRSWGVIDSLNVKPEAQELRSRYLRAIDSTWTIYNFGPLRVPYSGMKLKLNDKLFYTYKGVIRKFEGVDLQYMDNRFFVNGQEIFEYEFKEDYYFMMGDNREDSNDSRYSQFVPERNILGRADRILFSNDWRGVNWRRLWLKL